MQGANNQLNLTDPKVLYLLAKKFKNKRNLWVYLAKRLVSISTFTSSTLF